MVHRDPLRGRGDTTHRFLRSAFVGTYPPRQCGIATFTADLAAAVRAKRPGPPEATWDRSEREPVVTVEITAVDGEARGFPAEVRLRLDPNRPLDYLRIADRLNRSALDVVALQHEFGIYGGSDGERVVGLLEELDVPVVTTLHTVLRHPSPNQSRVLRAIARRSSRVVVMARTSARILNEVYGVEEGRIRVIPHGVPDLAFVDPESVKPLVGLAGREILLSFGLLGPGKGLELAIRSMTGVLEAAPAACYVILGATHPELRRRDGEAYRRSLQALVKELDLENHVLFVDQYVDLPTLCRWMQAADVFVTPYPGAEQATSGTLAYALAAGKALVSTPYAYARELLADGRGQLVPFGDHHALGQAIAGYLTDRNRRDAARRRAYAYGRTMTWPRVGAAYRSLFAEVASEAAGRSTASLQPRVIAEPSEATSVG